MITLIILPDKGCTKIIVCLRIDEWNKCYIVATEGCVSINSEH
jgi:hypothetical protein